jgi:hypothetical protein
LPFISAAPQSQTVDAGSSVTFAVTASGTPPLSYQWLFDARAILGATTGSYTVTNLQLPDAGPYSVIVSNVAGSVTSAVAVLTIRGVQPTAPTLQPLTQVGGYPLLTWTTVAGWRYQVWFTEPPANPSWTNLGSALTASGSTLEFTDPTPLSQTSMRFYRVQVLATP